MAPEASDSAKRVYTIAPKSFTELLNHSRTWRHTLATQSQRGSIYQFSCSKVNDPDRTRVYALGTYGGSNHTILYADIPRNAPAIESSPTVNWKSLLSGGQVTPSTGVMTKEEELQRERMRCVVQGITSYDYDPTSGTFLFSANGHLYRCVDDQKSDSVSPAPVDVPLNVSGAPQDPKICPVNPQLLAFVCLNDLYIHFGPIARQVTFAHDSGAAKLCGVPSFIIQEEFDRYSGYWWRPVVENNTYYILYEETDESSVLELSINIPATRADNAEIMRYPRTGTNNPTWALKLLKIQLIETSDEHFESRKDAKIEELHFSVNIRQMFPWAEYMIRAGWVSDGRGIWFQIMSRTQDRLALVYAPMDLFRNGGEQKTFMQGGGQAESMEDLTTDGKEKQAQVAPVSVLHEEYTPGMWINFHDILQFVHVDDTQVEFLWPSGKSGFTQIYHVTSSVTGSIIEPTNSSLSSTLCKEVQLTAGDWDVRRQKQVYVDKDRKLVYFLGSRESPLETHIYVCSYEHPGEVQLLTDLGHSYGGPRDTKPVCISADGRLLATSRYNLSQPGESVVYALNDPISGHLPQSTLIYRLSKNGLAFALQMPMETITTFEDPEVPILFTHDSQRTGYRHYAYLFKPLKAQPGFKYPTILYVYAGPDLQLVKNAWMGSQCFQKYTSLGYAVVMADGRGTPNRGVQFEATLKNGLGTFEIEDQVEILTEVANRSGVVDMERVALLGWSYGGYMALLGLAQRPDIFKVAIAGAPVTVWSFYDTAYTERFMGLPQFNQDGYVRSSVLSYIDKLPNECGRLLILHGLIDENVHFRHTSTLISAMIQHGKPYQLQIFPSDRHAVRNSGANEHMDATVLDFFQRNL